jgi:hypothetical protein
MGHRGVGDVTGHAAMAHSAILRLAKKQQFITSEDVSKAMGGVTGQFMGPALNHAAKDGIISLAGGGIKSSRKVTHCRLTRVWESAIYSGPKSDPPKTTKKPVVKCAVCGEQIDDVERGIVLWNLVPGTAGAAGVVGMGIYHRLVCDPGTADMMMSLEDAMEPSGMAELLSMVLEDQSDVSAAATVLALMGVEK